MPKSIFLFDGGNYKRGIDSGRSRVPLTPQEAELIFADPELPGDTDNSIATELNMKKYASELCQLEVGDELFVGLAPDAAVYRGLWMMSFDALPGLEVDVDLVPVKDVYAQWLANNGNATGVTTTLNTAPSTLAYDFANGLGHSTKDANDLANLYGTPVTNHRNNDALAVSAFATQRPALLGESVYFRLTITAVPAGNLPEAGCCSNCGEDAYPTFQVGAWYDRLCVDKQRVRKFCNCPESLCGEGCDEPYVSEEGTAPEVTIAGVYDDGTDTITLTVTFDQDVTGFDPTVDITTTEPGSPGATISFNNTSGGPAVYTVVYDVTNGSGGDVTFQVPAASATGVVGGLDNTVSNLETVTIPGV